MTIKIGLMGCGVVADYGHIPAIKAVEELELTSIYDPDPARLREMQQRHGVGQAFTDVDAFFESGIDAVTLTSPAPAHTRNVADAARHRKPVLCEKPLSMTEDEGRSMIAAMADADLPLYVGFCYRFSPAALEIKRLVDDGAIGDVRSLRLIYNWDCHGKYYRPDPHGRPDHWVTDPRRDGRMAEGGPMVDCGTHQIDLAVWWLGSPIVRHHGHGAWVDDYHAPDHVWVHMDHANGAHTMVEISYSYGHTTRDKFSHFAYELIGADGMVVYHRNHGFFELRTHQETRRLPYSEEKEFVGMYRAFAEALDAGRNGHLCTAEEALRVTAIARHATDQVIAQRLAPSA